MAPQHLDKLFSMAHTSIQISINHQIAHGDQKRVTLESKEAPKCRPNFSKVFLLISVSVSELHPFFSVCTQKNVHSCFRHDIIGSQRQRQARNPRARST